MSDVEGLAGFRRRRDRMRSAWPAFLGRRAERLREHERFGHAAERATERVLDDLFVSVLDWSDADLNHQVGFADLMLTRLGGEVSHGAIDARRLPKAVQCVISNYRGRRVSRVPGAAIGEVLVRLACAAQQAGKMPWQAPGAAAVYRQLALAIDQLGRMDDVRAEGG